MRRVATKSFGCGNGALVWFGFVVVLGMRHGKGELAGAVGSRSVLGGHAKVRGCVRAYLERRVQRFSLLSIGSGGKWVNNTKEEGEGIQKRSGRGWCGNE